MLYIRRVKIIMYIYIDVCVCVCECVVTMANGERRLRKEKLWNCMIIIDITMTQIRQNIRSTWKIKQLKQW